MDSESMLNMSLDEIIKLKRANNKSEKKGAGAKGPKGYGNKKFGNGKRNVPGPRKGGNENTRRIQKSNKSPRAPPKNVQQKKRNDRSPVKSALIAKKKTNTVNLNKAATKKLVNNLVKKALKTAAGKSVVAGRTRLTTRNMRKRVTAPVPIRRGVARTSAISSRLTRVSNQSRVIRRPVRVVSAPHRLPRNGVVRGRGNPRFRQSYQNVQQQPIRIVERNTRAPVVVRRERIVAPARSYLENAPQNTVVVRRVPAQRPQFERFEQRPVQRRVVYVERSRPQTQRVIVRNVQGENRRFASSNTFLPEVIVRRGRGFSSRR